LKAFQKPVARDRPQWVYSVEKLSFCAVAILPINHFAAENQP
jgi:hypothetical protein